MGRKVHALVFGNSLVSLYFKIGEMETARFLFDEMPVRDLVTWNNVISGYVKNSKFGNTLVVFDRMRRRVVLLEKGLLCLVLLVLVVILWI